MIRIGIDVGSTTIKIAVIDHDNTLLMSAYERHQADVKGALLQVLAKASARVSTDSAAIMVTGSIGIGVSEMYALPFLQEVVCATQYTQCLHKNIRTIIDIGGEDAKVVFLNDLAECVDMRMNGNCAGGTGSFIDQMAALLDKSIGEIDIMAQNATQLYPIASRCGVFSKTDIQNLIARNARQEDIAASIFRAVAVQTITTLSKGTKIKGKILFCGGPLTFIASLRDAFCQYLKVSKDDCIVPPEGNIVPAYGAALSATKSISFEVLLRQIRESAFTSDVATGRQRLFDSMEQYQEWCEQKRVFDIPIKEVNADTEELYIGVDSGSTTTKIVAINANNDIVYTFYAPSSGEPIACVRRGLEELQSLCEQRGATLLIGGSCSTGYGEELIKKAFGFTGSIVETIAHYLGAKQINPDCSFVLDIGGQDMKAIFIAEGTLTHIDINEACSSGCGTFIEAFATSLGMPIQAFVLEAIKAKNPCNLGTRCTVFMNSRVKQALRYGATLGDVAAGLSYSVVRNCLHKVLKLSNAKKLGGKIVLHGGTMRNDAVVRAFELETQQEVYRSNCPELMGAYGCALYAKRCATKGVTLQSLMAHCEYQSRQIECKGCENKCAVRQYTFSGSRKYYSGNKCENVFNNYPKGHARGKNLYEAKLDLLFNRTNKTKEGLRLGIPRVLNFYENYPFWHTLFDRSGVSVVLSDVSNYARYERSVHNVMSDNICFPAKLVHSHIDNLSKKGVDRVFMPFVLYEKMDAGTHDSYNCPIVSGYNEVVRSVAQTACTIDSPAITFKDKAQLEKQCIQYLNSLGVQRATAKKALAKAYEKQEEYENAMLDSALKSYMEAHERGELTIVLAGRPYHADPLIQHKISDIIASMGVNVIPEDIARGDVALEGVAQSDMIMQWSYASRVLRAAALVASYPADIHFVMLTSFGCGPDAFLMDQVQDVLHRAHKSLTLLKLDDINNVGSLKLRVRSLIESLKLKKSEDKPVIHHTTTKRFEAEDATRRLIVPYFTEYISPLIPSVLSLVGYDVIPLPKSDMVSAEMGLCYANNEVCYPATLVVGDILKYLHGCEDTSNIAVVITQTGGQCRASNYISLIKKGMVEAGFADVPVASVTFGSDPQHAQPGFSINWLKILPITLSTVLFADILSLLYHSAVVREKVKGDAERLKVKYLSAAQRAIARNDSHGVYTLVGKAAREFDSIINKDLVVPKVGIVGEIYLKFHSFANRNIEEWLIDNGIEVVPPVLTDFFMQYFVNNEQNTRKRLVSSRKPQWVDKALFMMINHKIKRFNAAASAYSFYKPLVNIYTHAAHGKEIVSLVNQFGEGWLLPADIVSFVKHGINNVISLQPFGCIANHIVSRGVEKKIKSLYPQLHFLSLDFDSGVSDANILNRLLLFKSMLK